MWSTVPTQRTVLVVVHTVTSANRLLDVLPIFEADLRVRLVFTAPGTSPVTAGVDEFFAEIGATPISWDEALRGKFDLVIAVNHSGDLYRLDGPLIILSHGIGYTKKIARKSEIRNQKSEIRNRFIGLWAFRALVAARGRGRAGRARAVPSRAARPARRRGATGCAARRPGG